ncbi:formate dehydrogenase accessory sulfurtransferase FdhD [Neisseria arctica]|uniref:formate dehydrogenase accessory sulfurtransferase FdhD n=1 Tax=Neisseria arctica TaxID=1470200 RepID=UPI00064A03B1|nr:formate dehydrogenase accessory sulfurtransferase FdhD [Neisseria arctica]UOO86223.1 formate dehydrogenase accessory sulfurtransferase FdhD [Neisseria arctica]
MLNAISSIYIVSRFRNGSTENTDDLLAEETPVALVYNGIAHVVLMATPADITELALGFSLSEGILSHVGELYDVETKNGCNGIEVHLEIASARFLLLKERRRNMNGRTGCGLCGVESLEAVRPDLPEVARGHIVQAQDIQAALQTFDKYQTLRAQTGAVHGAAWVEEGLVVKLFEDVGRHNALDKLLGWGAKNNIDWQRGWVLVSSRASYEMVAKAAAMGVGLLVAVSAPTAFAVRLAEQAGMTLIGFAREHQYTVYTHPDYIQTACSGETKQAV